MWILQQLVKICSIFFSTQLIQSSTCIACVLPTLTHALSRWPLTLSPLPLITYSACPLLLIIPLFHVWKYNNWSTQLGSPPPALTTTCFCLFLCAASGVCFCPGRHLPGQQVACFSHMPLEARNKNEHSQPHCDADERRGTKEVRIGGGSEG